MTTERTNIIREEMLRRIAALRAHADTARENMKVAYAIGDEELGDTLKVQFRGRLSAADELVSMLYFIKGVYGE